MTALSPDKIAALLEQDKPKRYPVPEQIGPLRWVDNTLRCASRGCSAPTWHKLQGVPYCSPHALRLMNEMLYKFGVEK